MGSAFRWFDGMGIKFEDLLLSSKFFYIEGSEDSNHIFPDEIKEYGNIESSRHNLNDSESRKKQNHGWNPDDLDIRLLSRHAEILSFW